MIIPEGPAWAAVGILAAALAFVAREAIKALRTKQRPSGPTASSGIEDERRTTDAVRLVLDRIALAERVIQENVSKTRHDLAGPLQSVILILSEVRQIAQSIERRKP